MTYREENGTVTLAMTRDDHEQLIMMLGYAVAAFGHSEQLDKQFYAWLDFVNRLNTGNPRWRPYQIPEEYQAP